MHDDSLALTEAAAQGDREAIDVLLLRYLPELRAFVRLRIDAMARAQESSSDLVQSVCREVLEHMDTFRFAGEGAFKSWLFTTALRKVRKRGRHYRTEKRDVRRNAAAAASGSNDRQIMACYHSFTSPSGQAMNKEEMERVESAFDELTDEQREVVSLAYLVGLPRAEIAAQTGRTDGAVRVLLHRALAKLSRVLTPR